MNLSMNFGIELLLVALAVFQVIGFIVTYVLAVHYGHVNPGFPYISDTGGKPPESCIFTLICSISAIIGLVIIYIRFQHIHQYYGQSLARIKILNIILFFIGITSVFGFLLVGAFQDDEVIIVHLVGAFMVFGFGTLYMWLQTLLSYRIYHASLTRHVSSVIILFRLLLSISATVFLIATIVSSQIAGQQRRHQVSFIDKYYWDHSNAGYALHLTSTIAEWCLAGAFLLYFLTFHVDFMRITVVVSVTLRNQYLSLSESTPLTV